MKGQSLLNTNIHATSSLKFVSAKKNIGAEDKYQNTCLDLFDVRGSGFRTLNPKA